MKSDMIQKIYDENLIDYMDRVNMSDRDKEIVKIFLSEKLTYREIGERFNISHERVRQILIGYARRGHHYFTKDQKEKSGRNENSWVDKNKIYAVKWGNSPASHLAMYADPAFNGFEGICYLTPGERGHMIEGRLGEKTETGFTFYPERLKEDGVWEFIEVTYDNFKEEFYKIVISGDTILEKVSTTKELENWYHKEFPRR